MLASKVRQLVCAVFFTIPVLLRAESTEPKDKPITVKGEEEGEERSWEVDSIERSRHIFPSNYGQAGIFRVRSAEGLPEGTLSFGIGGEFYWVNDAPLYNGSSTAQTIAENLFVGYSPIEHLTLSMMRKNSSSILGNPQALYSSLGDFTFSGLYSFPLSEVAALAPLVDFMVASEFNALAPSGNTVSAGLGLAFTLSFYRLIGLPLFLHANVKYHLPEIRSSATQQVVTHFGLSQFHTVKFSLGAELDIGDTFVPFLELNQVSEFGTSIGNTFPMKMSVGTRFMPFENKGLAFLLGADIGLIRPGAIDIPFTPSYEILGQVSYTFGLSQTERKHYATTKDVNVVDRRFILRKHIEFKLDSAELQNTSHHLLDQIADVVKENKVRKLLIIGHTDSSHTEGYNIKLSQTRADTVKKYLESHGVGDGVLLTQGYGKRKPVASNLTEEGRTKNRRVEFYVLD